MPKLPPASPNATFAIIDDHRAVADIMGYALETKLHATCIARYNTISESGENLAKLNPKVVVIDWRIESHTSASLIKDLTPKLPGTRWLLFTAWPTAAVLREAIPAGIHGCVSKSADYEELARAVGELLSGGSYFCQESMKALGRSIGRTSHGSNMNETERTILRCIAEGHEPKEISQKINLSAKTVHNYLVIIRRKLNLASMVDLAKFAIEQGIAPPR